MVNVGKYTVRPMDCLGIVYIYIKSQGTAGSHVFWTAEVHGCSYTEPEIMAGQPTPPKLTPQ